MLCYALNPSLQKRLDYREIDESLPTSYDDFVLLLHRLAGTTTTATQSGGYLANRPAPIKENLAMDLNAVTLGAVIFDDQDLPAIGTTTAPSSTLAQRARWQEIGCCRQCGQKNHIVRNCPFLPYALESA